MAWQEGCCRRWCFRVHMLRQSSTLNSPLQYLQKLPDHISVSLQQSKGGQVSSAAEVITGDRQPAKSCMVKSSENQLRCIATNLLCCKVQGQASCVVCRIPRSAGCYQLHHDASVPSSSCHMQGSLVLCPCQHESGASEAACEAPRHGCTTSSQRQWMRACLDVASVFARRVRRQELLQRLRVPRLHYSEHRAGHVAARGAPALHAMTRRTACVI